MGIADPFLFELQSVKEFYFDSDKGHISLLATFAVTK